MLSLLLMVGLGAAVDPPVEVPTDAEHRSLLTELASNKADLERAKEDYQKSLATSAEAKRAWESIMSRGPAGRRLIAEQDYRDALLKYISRREYEIGQQYRVEAAEAKVEVAKLRLKIHGMQNAKPPN